MRVTVGACSLFAVATSHALGSAGTTFGGPLGATDINNAYLPPNTGVYFGLTEFWGQGNRLFDNTGRSIRATAEANVVGLYGMYVYPFKVFSGTLASGLQQAYVDPQYVELATGNAAAHVEGWDALYVDFINWSRYIGPLFGEHLSSAARANGNPYGLTAKVEYSMIFPTGNYKYNSVSNNESNDYYFIPNFSLTYLTPPNVLGDGLQLNVHVFYNIQSEVPKVQYDSGDVWDTDFAIAEKMGRWTAGIAGDYAFQLQDDHQGPNHVIVNGDGNRIESLSIGPVAEFDLPKDNLGFKFKATTPLITRSTINLTQFVFNILFHF